MKYRFLDKLMAKNADFHHHPAPVMVCLGDSVTQGCFELYNPTPDTIDTVFEQQYAYSQLLKNAFNLLYPRANALIVNAGHSGGTAKQALGWLERDVFPFNPDLVVVAFALNDTSDTPDGLSTFSDSLRGIFEQCRARGIDCMYVTPNMMNTHTSGKITDDVSRRYASIFAERQNSGLLERFVEEGKRVARECGAGVCDVYGAWKRLAACGVDTTDLLANYLNHPIRPMQQLIDDKILEELFSEQE